MSELNSDPPSITLTAGNVGGDAGVTTGTPVVTGDCMIAGGDEPVVFLANERECKIVARETVLRGPIVIEAGAVVRISSS